MQPVSLGGRSYAMAGTLHHLHFPNESPTYREARNKLLAEEMELRRQVERVAAHRRALPSGGEVPKNYVPPEAGQDYRHNDLLDPLWNLFDLTPEGRGDFQPKLDYS